MTNRLVVVAGGSGQHASVVFEAANLAGLQIVGIATMPGNATHVDPFVQFLGEMPDVFEPLIACDHKFVVASGSNDERRFIHDFLVGKGGQFQTVIHPAAMVSPSAKIGHGSVIHAGAIVSTNAELGIGVIVNHAASVDHNCILGDFVNISPGARLGGGVVVGNSVAIGLNASILQGRTIGYGAVVGAGRRAWNNRRRRSRAQYK